MDNDRYEIQLTDWVTVVVHDLGSELLLVGVAGLALVVRALRLRGQLNFQLGRGVAVHQILGRLLEACGADRVLVYEVRYGSQGWGCRLLSEVFRSGLGPVTDREIPVEVLWAEFEALQDGRWHRYAAVDSSPCSLYLKRAGLREQWSRLLYWRGLPTGLLAVQFRDRGRRQVPPTTEGLVDDLKRALRHGRRRPAAKG